MTTDEPGAVPGPDQRIACAVDGEVMQDANTGDLLFDPLTLVSYLSTVLTLLPGDVIATGTPGGRRRRPHARRASSPTAQVVVTTIAGVGELRNRCRREVLPG